MLRLQYLQQSEGEYPVLQLNETSMRILKGEMRVMLVKSVETRKEAPLNTQSTSGVEADLFKILKAVRYQLAKENVAAFQVF